jgi:lipopolysaccharide transport system ATP-binding protein
MKALELTSVTKDFSYNRSDQGLLFSSLLSLVGSRTEKHTVISDVSFILEQGETLGIIGNNGAGKSTLLKLIAGIMQPSSGTLQAHGSVLFLGGLAHGFKQHLTVEDNIKYIAAVFGIPAQQSSLLVPIILSEANLDNSRFQKMYQLSRGMRQRLAFSLTIHCAPTSNPEIVLLDEVFSKGGDVRYKVAASKKLAEYIAAQKTIVLVSHNLDFMRTESSRIIWLDEGSIRMDGDPERVVRAYIRANSEGAQNE